MITLPALPFDKKALEPHISEQTLNFHYDKHHQGYVTNLNNLIKDTPFDALSLEDIIVQSAQNTQHSGIFNNAAQVWNHTFYWHSMKPQGGQLQDGPLLAHIKKDFESFEDCIKQFKTAALTQFGSGWAWLVLTPEGTLKIEKTANAQTPLTAGTVPLLTIDVWEHAYYLDFQNLRAAYVDAFFAHLANWDHAAEIYENHISQNGRTL